MIDFLRPIAMVRAMKEFLVGLFLTIACAAHAASLNLPDSQSGTATFLTSTRIVHLQTNSLTLALGDTVRVHAVGSCHQGSNIGTIFVNVFPSGGIANLSSDGRHSINFNLGSNGDEISFDYTGEFTVSNDATNGDIVWSDRLSTDVDYSPVFQKGNQSFNTPTLVAGLFDLYAQTTTNSTASVACIVYQASITSGSTSWATIS